MNPINPINPSRPLDVEGVPCQRWEVDPGVVGFAWRHPAPRGAVLIQHGYGDHTAAYRHRNCGLVRRLLQSDLSVYGMDMPGNGVSAGVRGATEVERAIELHLAFRREVHAADVPLFLLGHSLGGLVTITSALRRQYDLAGVVLLAPAVKYSVGPVVRFVARLGAQLVPNLAGPMPAGSLGSLTRVDALAREMRDDPLMYLGRVRWTTLGSAATISHANWGLYTSLRLPLLAVHGSEDVNTDPNGSRELVELAASIDKTVHIVPQGRHALLDDTDRVATRHLVIDWILERLPAQTTTEPEKGARP